MARLAVGDPRGRRKPVEAEGLGDGGGRLGLGLRRRVTCRRLGDAPVEMLRLRFQGTPCLSRDVCQRRPRASSDGGNDGSLGQRSVAQQDPLPPALVEQFQCRLRRQDGAAEVHDHQHAVLGPCPLDGRCDQGGARPESASGLHTSRGLDGNGGAAHLPGKFDDPLGEARAVGDDNQADHFDKATRGPLLTERPTSQGEEQPDERSEADELRIPPGPPSSR